MCYFENQFERTPIETISFYYESDNNYFFLGKYDKYGIYNKNQELIYCNPYTESFIGYTEDILEDPFYTGQYVNEDRFGPGAFEPYVNIQIIISPKNGQKIPKITNLQYNKGRANYGTKKKSIYG